MMIPITTATISTLLASRLVSSVLVGLFVFSLLIGGLCSLVIVFTAPL